MARVFNAGLGRAVQLAAQGAAFVLVLLEAAEAEAALSDYDTLEDLLAEAGNTELADGSYGRKNGLEGTVVIDDDADEQTVSLPDQTFVGLSGDPVVKALICYALGAGDPNVLPISMHDVAFDPDGSDQTVRMP